MTKSTITREQLEEWVAQFEEDGGCDATDRQLEALIRQSLAAMNNEPVAFTEKHEISNMHATGLYLRAWPADRARNSVEGYTIPLYTTPQPISLVNSEPVAYIFKHPAGRLFWALTDESNKGHDDVMPVYAAPQPAMVAPVCTCPSGDGSLRWLCPVHPGNYPAQSDCCPAQNQGWIPVSERLPDDEQEVIVQTHSGWRYVAFYDKHSGLFYDSPEGDVEYVLVTYWQPLPAPPQEVTSARVHPARGE